MASFLGKKVLTCLLFLGKDIIFMNKIKQNYQNYSLSRMKEILFNLGNLVI